jgi:enoyl-CoA hydratase
MAISHTISSEGIAEIAVDRPPVNALDIASWYALARLFDQLGADPAVRVVILAAEGRGFNAGVDIKEIQARPGHDALLDVNRACYQAFRAVYECEVPVIAAVHGYCLGGGIGLVGNADLIVASEDATFGLPEVDRGALGAATHLARLVPPHQVRAMLLLGSRATAQQLHAWGAVLQVVPGVQLRDTARAIAGDLARKRPRVLRAAKHCLNGLDPIDPNKSYRYEQGFTFELHLAGEGDAAREAFLRKDRP